jgi:transcription elongation factor Elf1
VLARSRARSAISSFSALSIVSCAPAFAEGGKAEWLMCNNGADLSAAVDVYSDWVDACDAVAKEDVEEGAGGEYAPSRPAAGRPGGGRARDDDEDLEDLIDDEGEDAGGYRGNGVVADDEDY